MSEINLNENMKTLDKMRKKHAVTMERIKLQSELDIEKDTLLNDLKLKRLRNSKSQIESKREIFVIKNLVRKDSLTRRAGKLLKFWAILVTIISTLITIAGGYKDYNNSIYSLVGFVGAVIVLQFTVFIIASQESRIKQDFFVHAWKCTTLKYALLSVSIYNNYKFFSSDKTNNLITLLLCVGLDLICVFLVGLAYDQITLNLFKKDKKTKSLLDKLFYNLTAKKVSKINQKYSENKNLIENNEDNIRIEEIEPKEKLIPSSLSPSMSLGNFENKNEMAAIENKNINVEGKTKNMIGFNLSKSDSRSKVDNNKINNNTVNKQDSILPGQNKNHEGYSRSNIDDFDVDDIKEYLKCMYSLSKNDISIGQTKIRDNTNLTEQQIRNIRYFLAKNNVIEIDGRQTKIIAKNYNNAIELIN